MENGRLYIFSTPNWNLGVELVVGKYKLGVFSVRTPAEAAATAICTYCILPIHQAVWWALHNKSYVTGLHHSASWTQQVDSDIINTTSMVTIGPLYCILYFCAVLYSSHWPRVGGYQALDMLLIQIEMWCRCKIFTIFQRYSRKRMVNTSLIFLYWLHIGMVILWIDWIK